MSPFGWWIAIYFALATLAAGTAGAACVLLRRGDESSLLRARAVLLISFLAISLGMLALIADLEHPSEFWLTIKHYNPASWISRGSRIAMFFTAVTALLLLVVRNGEDRDGWTAMGVPILFILAISLAIYPSFVLAQELGRPNWQSPLLPILFGVGALHIGTSILGTSRGLEVGLAVLEFGLVASYLATTQEALSSLAGTLLGLLTLGCVFLWLLPTLLRGASPADMVVKAASLVVGCFGIRSVIMITGIN